MSLQIQSKLIFSSSLNRKDSSFFMTKKRNENKRITNFTFKISIDYKLRGYCREHGIADEETFLSANNNSNRRSYKETLVKRFNSFCDKYKVVEGSNRLHDDDYHLNKQNQLVHDDWHVHFVVHGSKDMKATESAWRKRLASCGLALTDESRLAKNPKADADFDEMTMKDYPSAFSYLIHRTPKSISEGKHAYDQNGIWTYHMTRERVQELLKKGGANGSNTGITYIKFNSDDTSTELEEDNRKIIMYLSNLYGDKGKVQGKTKQQLAQELDTQLTAAANMYTDEIRNGMTVSEVKKRSQKVFGEYHPKFWRLYHKSFENEEQEYNKRLMQQLPYRDRNFSLFFFYGLGGVGKTVVGDDLAFLLSDKKEHKIHTIATNGKRKTFDLVSSYDNELVSVAHEVTPDSMGIDEFENITEPHRYPSINSRNKDKAYFAQSLIITQPDNPAEFVYQMIYDDYLKHGRHADRYGYVREVDEGNGHTERLSFPSNYGDFCRQFGNENSVFWKHWTLNNSNMFFKDVWQILRRVRFTLGIERVTTNNKQHEINIIVKHVKENSQMLDVNGSLEYFRYNSDFNNFFEDVGTYHINNYLDKSEVLKVLGGLLMALKQFGLKISSSLPRLMSDEELQQYMIGDEDWNNYLYDDVSDVKNTENADKTDLKLVK